MSTLGVALVGGINLRRWGGVLAFCVLLTLIAMVHVAGRDFEAELVQRSPNTPNVAMGQVREIMPAWGQTPYYVTTQQYLLAEWHTAAWLVSTVVLLLVFLRVGMPLDWRRDTQGVGVVLGALFGACYALAHFVVWPIVRSTVGTDWMF
jgi:hypothetical protein